MSCSCFCDIPMPVKRAPRSCEPLPELLPDCFYGRCEPLAWKLPISNQCFYIKISFLKNNQIKLFRKYLLSPLPRLFLYLFNLNLMMGKTTLIHIPLCHTWHSASDHGAVEQWHFSPHTTTVMLAFIYLIKTNSIVKVSPTLF